MTPEQALDLMGADDWRGPSYTSPAWRYNGGWYELSPDWHWDWERNHFSLRIKPYVFSVYKLKDNIWALKIDIESVVTQEIRFYPNAPSAFCDAHKCI